MNKKKEIWLQTGYQEFARYGPDALKVDKIASLVGKSRSSFYHQFGDMINYEDALFQYHWEYSLLIVQKLEDAETFYPDFAELLQEEKTWAFAHMNTFHFRDRSEKFAEMFENVTQMIEPKIGHLWASTVGLDDLPVEKTKYLFRVIREAVFTRLSYESYSPEILMEEVRKLNNSLQFLLSGSQSE